MKKGYIYLSMHLFNSIFPPIYSFIHPSIHASIHLSATLTHQSFLPSIHLPIYLFICLFTTFHTSETTLPPGLNAFYHVWKMFYSLSFFFISREPKVEVKTEPIKPTYWCVVCRQNGLLEIYTLPDFKLVFYVKNFNMAPKVLVDSGDPGQGAGYVRHLSLDVFVYSYSSIFPFDLETSGKCKKQGPKLSGQGNYKNVQKVNNQKNPDKNWGKNQLKPLRK